MATGLCLHIRSETKVNGELTGVGDVGEGHVFVTKSTFPSVRVANVLKWVYFV